MENQVRERGGKIQNKEEIVRVVSDSVRFFDDVVVREEIYRLNLARVQIKDEIEKLEA